MDNSEICAACGGVYGLHNHMNKACPKDINASRDHTEYRETVFTPPPTSAHLKTGSEAYVFDIEDAINKIRTLNEYCRSFGLGKKVPHELYAVVEECDEFLKAYENQPKIVITGGEYEIVKPDTVSCEPKN